MSPGFRLSWLASELKAVVRAARDLAIVVGACAGVACEFEADRTNVLVVDSAISSGGMTGGGDGGAAGGSCGGRLVECSGVCVDPKSDEENCGACGSVCGASERCLDGACACLGNKTHCGTECVNADTDPAHCGACETTCDVLEACLFGECKSSCDPLLKCGRACVDPQRDLDHCGDCNTKCLPGQLCGSGQCKCPVGQKECGGACIAANDRDHCGRCDSMCETGMACSAGSCVLECRPWETNCEGSCTNLTQDRDHCGECHVACPTEQQCDHGTCACPGSKTACGDTCVDLKTERAHCGDCDARCAEGKVCSAGTCETTCSSELTNCGGSCVDLKRDHDHCGTCDSECPAEQSCNAGSCTCPGSQLLCGDVCVSTLSDSAHCGGCNQRCPSGQVCSRANCEISCQPGETRCGDACAVLLTDLEHCGECGHPCAVLDQRCVGGVCSCPAGKQLCSGKCVDTQNDRAYCGSCGNACGAGNVCSRGRCEPSCGGGLTNCNGGCVNLQTDGDHCGTCEMFCPKEQICTGGVCGCPSGQAVCGRVCVNLENDRSNCGACGNACPRGSVCSNRSCVPSCQASQTDCGGSCVDQTKDRENCGACGASCQGVGEFCAEGHCRCPANQVVCGGSCVNTTADRSHCGSCERACPSGSVCSEGSCLPSCAPGAAECDGACVDTQVDPRHCGACHTACASEQACRNGVCSCPTNQTLCGGACVDTRIDPTNCGQCGQHCALGQACVAGECSSGSHPEPRCLSTLPVALNAFEGWPRQAPPTCALLPDGTGRMTYTLPSCGDGPYASCVFANGVNLNDFDADNQAGGILEVEFCTSQPIAGELNLWYGAVPTRKKIVLLGPGESMQGGCRTVRRAPEQAICHWRAQEKWSGDCQGADVPGWDKSCRQCGSSCNQGCPIHFTSTRLELTAEQCSVPQASPVDIDLRSVRFLPKDCACTSNAQCADATDRSKCETGLFSSSVCPAGAAICGACVSPTPTCSGAKVPCGNVCVDTATDAANCGGCGMACDSGEVCRGSHCAVYCPVGFTECSGRCIDLENDPEHCGACPVSCAFDHGVAACVEGVCRLAGCAAGFGDADHLSWNGCECKSTQGNTNEDPDPCDGVDNDCDGVADWTLKPFPHSSCQCEAPINLVQRGDLGSPNTSSEQCKDTTCRLLSSGAMEMSYCFSKVCSSVYATCVFAGPTDLETFDVDFGNDGFLEVIFEVVSTTLSGKLHLSYGKNPARKYVTLVERGQSLSPGIHRKYFAPEQVRYASASPICTEACGACPAIHDNPSYRFNATDMTLVGEGCAAPVDATLRLLSVRIAPRKNCACFSDSDCARNDTRKVCASPGSNSPGCDWPNQLGFGVCGVGP